MNYKKKLMLSISLFNIFLIKGMEHTTIYYQTNTTIISRIQFQPHTEYFEDLPILELCRSLQSSSSDNIIQTPESKLVKAINELDRKEISSIIKSISNINSLNYTFSPQPTSYITSHQDSDQEHILNVFTARMCYECLVSNRLTTRQIYAGLHIFQLLLVHTGNPDGTLGILPKENNTRPCSMKTPLEMINESMRLLKDSKKSNIDMTDLCYPFAALNQFKILLECAYSRKKN